MRLQGRERRTIEAAADGRGVRTLDQRRLPHEVVDIELRTVDAAAEAIAEMAVRGAPLIGVTAAYGLALQAQTDASDAALQAAAQRLKTTRPTAVNLAWAVDQCLAALMALPRSARAEAAWAKAGALADADVACNVAIGQHGLALLKTLAPRRPGRALQILTHCNAGWLATVDWGTALAPIYRAQREGIAVHVWVDETRPRNQGALTAFELREQGVAHTVIADNAGGHLMQHGEVDAVIVGCDRVSARGDAANKIGTYLKALAAHDNGLPFYVAMPTSTFDTALDDGLAQIEIEFRSPRELTHLGGMALLAEGSPALNPAFDVTPARLVSAFITERGVFAPAELARGLAHV